MPDSIKIDNFDVRILSTLQRHGRLANTGLAEIVGLSNSATWERVQRLEAYELIRGYRADIAVDVIPEVTVSQVAVVLTKHRAHDFKRFEQAIENLEEAVECLAVGGGVDYIVRFVTASPDQLPFIMDRLMAIDCGIEQYRTYVLQRQIKPYSGYPIERLLSSRTLPTEL